MLQSADKPFKTSIEAAVAYLIGIGKIKKDGDVVEALKMSKGTFSAYKSGKTEPSKNFVQEFENFYGIKLSDFEVGNELTIMDGQVRYSAYSSIPKSEVEQLRTENELLKNNIRSLEKVIQLQEKMLRDKDDGEQDASKHSA